MKTIINFTELSQLTGEKFTFSFESENSVRISGKIKVLMFQKDISLTLKVEKVGYSSITFTSSDPILLSTGLAFMSKNSIEDLGGGKIRLDFKSIPELSEITKRLKLDSLKFEESGIIIEISPRP